MDDWKRLLVNVDSSHRQRALWDWELRREKEASYDWLIAKHHDGICFGSKTEPYFENENDYNTEAQLLKLNNLTYEDVKTESESKQI